MHKFIKNNWAWCLVLLYLLCVILLYAIAGPDGARFAIADNLDLFQAQYQMLKNTGTFFAHHATAPFLHGITRNDLPSEWSLVSLLYFFLPSFQAYIANYIVKVLLATFSFTLLAKELFRRGKILPQAGPLPHPLFRNLTVLAGFAYGLLNLFPAFGICFASIPLFIWLLLQIDSEGSFLYKRDQNVTPVRTETKKSRLILLYFGIFCYPFLSYFSYFGLFLLGYLCLAWLWTSIARKRLNHRLFFAIVALALGSMVFEYRLFASMLFSGEVTIRSSMRIAGLTGAQILSMMNSVLKDGGTMHTQSVQTRLVLPVCTLYFCILNIGYLVRRQPRRIFHDLYNLAVLILLFNTAIYGLYYWEPFHTLVERLLPPLKGWQFNRTVFFNPFLWYGMFYIAIVRLAAFRLRESKSCLSTSRTPAANDKTREFSTRLFFENDPTSDDLSVEPHNNTATNDLKGRAFAALSILLALASAAVVMLTPTPDNDVYNTLHAVAYEKLRGQKEDSLSYSEFYSTALFEQAKADLGYNHEWAAAYGFHPAVLEYNDINTIDGYLGFYPEQYKEQFRTVIAPALGRQPATAQYFDDWGARCYLYSGTEGTNVEAVRNYPHQEEALYADTTALQRLDCRYIFSRPLLTNAEELGLTLRGTWTDEHSAYTLHVYEVQP